MFFVEIVEIPVKPLSTEGTLHHLFDAVSQISPSQRP
jgi:hypothetical protein